MDLSDIDFFLEKIFEDLMWVYVFLELLYGYILNKI